MLQNPFSKPQWHFARTDLAKSMLELMESGNRKALLIFERRRIGKTHFLTQDLTPLAQKRGWIVIYTSFLEDRALSAEDLIRYDLAKTLYDLAPSEVPDFLIEEIGAFGAKLKLKIQAKSKTPPQPVGTLKRVDALIEELCKKGRVLLLLDEFQAVLPRRGSHAFLEQLRTSLDKRPDQVAAVFTGSSLTGLNEIFNDKTGPFYSFARRVPFPPLGEEFLQTCRRAYKKTTQRDLPMSEAQSAFNRLDRVTGHFMEYIDHRIFNPDDSHEEALNAVYTQREITAAFQRQWAQLDGEDRAWLAMVVRGDRFLFGKDASALMAPFTKNKKPPNRSRIQTVQRRLTKAGIVDQVNDKWRVLDPDFEIWIRHQDFYAET